MGRRSPGHRFGQTAARACLPTRTGNKAEPKRKPSGNGSPLRRRLANLPAHCRAVGRPALSGRADLEAAPAWHRSQLLVSWPTFSSCRSGDAVGTAWGVGPTRAARRPYPCRQAPSVWLANYWGASSWHRAWRPRSRCPDDRGGLVAGVGLDDHDPGDVARDRAARLRDLVRHHYGHVGRHAGRQRGAGVGCPRPGPAADRVGDGGVAVRGTSGRSP